MPCHHRHAGTSVVYRRYIGGPAARTISRFCVTGFPGRYRPEITDRVYLYRSKYRDRSDLRGSVADTHPRGATKQRRSPPTTNPQEQASLITKAAAQHPKGLVVTIPDAAVLSGPIKQATSAGIPGKFGTIKLGTFDVSTQDLNAVSNGQVLFVIDQQPFLEGYMAVQVTAFEARYSQHPFGPIYTGPSLVTKANVAQVQQLYKSTGVPLFNGGYPQ
jgi:hypothetical protein